MRSKRATRRAEGMPYDSANPGQKLWSVPYPQRQCSVPAHWRFLTRQPTARAEACRLIPLVPSCVNFATYAQPIVSTPSEMLKAAVSTDGISAPLDHDLARCDGQSDGRCMSNTPPPTRCPRGYCIDSNPIKLQLRWNISTVVVRRRLHGARLSTRSL